MASVRRKAGVPSFVDRYPIPPAWVDFGARWGETDGLLYLGEWRRGFTVHELRAMWFECQMTRSLRADVRRLEADLERLSAHAQDVEKRCKFYRDQLRLESTMGAMLYRIAETD